MAFANPDKTWDLAVVGGGLAGLTAAAIAANSGLSVILLEQSKNLGGRAATTRREGISFNLGPHALYSAGEACKTLKSLGVNVQGGPPDQGEAFLFWNGQAYRWPQSLPSLLRSPLFTLSEKWQLARLLKRLRQLNPADYQNQSVAEWSRRLAGEGNLGRLIRTLVRLTTFINDPEYQSAGAALEQFQLGNLGVLYLDHGWQSLIDGLSAKAESLGVTISKNSAVVRAVAESDLIRTERKDGAAIFSHSLILATPPGDAAALLDLQPEHPLAQKAESVRPALVASLDVALRNLPHPRRRFGLGLNEPFYYSVHSGPAELGPEGVTVLHVMKYLGSEPSEPAKITEQQLRELLEQIQPGWKSHVVWQRFLPHLTAVSDIPTCQLGGTAGRHPLDVKDYPGVFLAGDWVGSSGQLADAVVASARTAVARVIHLLPRGRQLERVP